ncbi:Protein kinase-like (PK-like) [Glarea lozoyensis ATCC 20868]|uniref:Protein kinase-like (PK-like) n=1 Tax=Glarea lozoyensis (strain ATCC 20868 / MF5171) TaxID=1116229 RepID=S3CM03_GLAL2|nr:Protein kinase-like (PK-like) [Glarea lozoyensis ATCC 20868]EPE26730.1 Protein kinase-like (PK-like) [Glarea lozoyensis ATCC 20868]
MQSSDASTEAPPTDPSGGLDSRHESQGDDLERLYAAALSDIEGLLDSKYKWADDEACRIDDMVVQFRIWGVELNIPSGTLRWLQHDYVKEAAAIRVNLEAVQSSLTRFIYHLPRELIVEGKVEKETVTKTTLEDTHLELLDEFTRCVEALCDLSESLQIVISLHTNEGPAARVKEIMNTRKLASLSTKLPTPMGTVATRTQREIPPVRRQSNDREPLWPRNSTPRPTATNSIATPSSGAGSKNQSTTSRWVRDYGRHPIDDFLRWLSANESLAIDDLEQGIVCRSVSLSAVRSELEKNDGKRLVEILDVLFEDDGGPDPAELLSNYVAVFCILLQIGEGHYIQHFVDHAIHDDSEFDPELLLYKFPLSQGDDDFYRRFCEAQWRFCVPDFMKNMKKVFPDRINLPIIEKRQVARGGSATISIIKLHSSYDKLLGSRISDTHRRRSNANVYALKTYHSPDAQSYYETEVDAFRRLEWERPYNPHLIAFYGSYIHKGTYNVILEYADQGSLENYFQRTSPPWKSNDIINFWTSLFGILKALECIHMTGLYSKGEVEILNGCHRDVKPANILVISLGSSSPHDVAFKLADLGLSHFNKTIEGDAAATENTSFNGQTYAAPECLRSDGHWGYSALQAKQDVDIWSLGCVFSEAAVWISKSHDGLVEYRQARRAANNSLSDNNCLGECFHDGESVSETVLQFHSELPRTIRYSDYVTSQVVSIIDSDMLGVSGSRLTARQLWGRFDKLTQRANRRSTASSYSDAEGGNWKQVSGIQPDFSAGPSQRASFFTTIRNFDKPLNSMESLYDNYGNREYPQDSNYPRASTATTSSGSYSDPISRLTSMSRGSTVESTNQSKSRVSAIENSKQLKRRRQYDKLPHLSLSVAIQWRTERKRGNKLLNIFNKAERKAKLPGEWLFYKCQARDHVFVVDDSIHMRPHWDEMCQLFGILTYMVKGTDNDGLDLFFTMSDQTFNDQDTTKLVDIVTQRKAHLEGQSDMSLRLDHILGRYSMDLRNKYVLRNHNSSDAANKEIKPLSVYVFTNAMWTHDSNPEHSIKTMVDSLVHVGASRHQVGIQFISFGRDPECLDRLDKLDRNLGLKLDIVDHSPSNSNLWKILLGAIDPDVDGDYQSDTESSDGKSLC